MPSADVVIWTAVSALIVMMIALIAYMMKFGLEFGLNKILSEIQGLRNDIKIYREEVDNLKLKLRDMETRCHMIHGPEPTPCKSQHLS